jgi:predicted P-loop ATPase
MTTQVMIDIAGLQWLARQGAAFALPFGRTKNKFENGWPNNPHTLEDAVTHAQRGGNVGILVGKHSGNIIALDRDVDFPATVAMLGDAAKTAKIVRDNAPERGKLLYRVNGELPKTTSWKVNPGDKHPAAELLSTGRHALTTPSMFMDEKAGDTEYGNYLLQDTELGIMEVTPEQIDRIWWMITGEHLYTQAGPSHQQQTAREARDGATDSKEYVRQVKDAWPTLEVFKHWHKDLEGIKGQCEEKHVRGNGGLKVNDWRWFCHSDSVGGDQIDAWYYCKTGKVFDRGNRRAFWDTVNEMADAAGIAQPVRPVPAAKQQIYTNGHSKQSAKRTVDMDTGEILEDEPTKKSKEKPMPDPDTEDKSKGQMWLDALRSLGYTFRLNVLEDMVEVNGKRLDDILRSRIHIDMVSMGVSKTYVDDCINIVAGENSYHPVKSYLDNLVWDGIDRLDQLLAHIQGNEQEVSFPDGTTQRLYRLLMARWLLGCVARALDGDNETAFKHQTPMLVIIGKQGLGKSSFVRWLVSGIGYEYHRESPINPHSAEDIRSMVTKWIWEVSELGSSLRRGDRDALKGFITQEWHTYRKPWGKASITKPTLCNFVGTINPETGFLDDPTGHRRFLPVHITAFERGYDSINVNQLWAQLVHMYQTGVSPELSDAERTALEGSYGEHEIENPLQTYLQMYFTIEPGNDSLRCFTADIMQRLRQFGININNNPKVAGKEINDALAPLGLTRTKMSIDGVKGMGWIGIEENRKSPPIGGRL